MTYLWVYFKEGDKMENVEKIKPTGIFTNYIFKTIPLAFDESMSYYETLCGLLNLLKNSVIPTVNNNADAIIELQNFVDNYFKNLDVQQEINNKLDQMAESGQLTDIIAQYLGLAGVLAYNTKNDMKNATNLINGSICKTLGDDVYNDGLGNFYKIRTITTSDVIDNVHIIALNNSDTLIAELIPNYEISILTNKKLVMVGDSYGEQNEDGDITRFYYDIVREKLGLTDGINFFHGFTSGGGFGNGAYLNNLQNAIANVEDKTTITDILICGGWNDSDASQSYGSDEMFNAGILAFNNYVKQNCPNAKITLAHISWGNPKLSNNYDAIYDQLTFSIRRYKRACNTYAWAYITGAEYILHTYDNSYWQSDGNHPNQLGQNLLGNELTRAYVSGSTQITRVNNGSISASGNASFTNFNTITSILNGDNTEIFTPKTSAGIYFTINKTTTPTMSCDGTNEYELATFNSSEVVGKNIFVFGTFPCFFTGSHSGLENSSYPGMCEIFIHNSKIYIRPLLFINGQRQEAFSCEYLWIPNFKISAPSIYC